MPELIRSTWVGMTSSTDEWRRELGWALPASVILHALLVVLMLYGLPKPHMEPQAEQVVNVALVPPPEAPRPEPAAPPEEPPATAEQPAEPEAESPAEEEAAPPPPSRSPIEVLRPVFEFGDETTGPRESLDGDGAQESRPSPVERDDPEPPGADEAAESSPNEEAEAAATPDPAGQEQQGQEAAAPEVEEQQEEDGQAAAIDESEAQEPAPPALAADGDAGEVALPMTAQAPQPRPAHVPRPARASDPASRTSGGQGADDVAVALSEGFSGLPGVRDLYSQGATGDVRATTAMAGMPRDERGGKLCASVLQQQLLAAAYSPDLVPLVPLKSGNVLDVPDAAFHTRSTWYHLSFRCEVDAAATRVLSFDYRVGRAIPPADWARLGLPTRY